MNHGGMDHGGMDHGGMDHGGMDHGTTPHCSMNMVWNYDTTNLCILSSSWRITTPFSLYLSLSIIALSAILYEYLRLYIRRLDSKLARSSINSLSPTHRRRASLLPTSSSPSSSSGGGSSGISDRRSKRRSSNSGDSIPGSRVRWVKPLETTRRMQIWRSALYATSMGVSFLLMLISMTFNAYVIGAIVFV
ncbi:Copper transport protein CTR2 [Pseudozyma hubeiensis]|nr:Copper transport protein CTR2 [Pseudozyma hubeiensis]